MFLRKIQEGLSTTIPSKTIEDFKEKLHKLRTQYPKERTKIRSSSRIGVGLKTCINQCYDLMEKYHFR